jgi:glutaredoxin
MNDMIKEQKQDGSGAIPDELRDIPFVHVRGTDSGRGPIIFGLTTCGFCKKAIEYLESNQIAFSYVYVNKLSVQQRKLIKEYVSDTFDVLLTFPFLIFDESKWISGFLRVEWKRLFRL